MVTTDKDYGQLVSDNILCISRTYGVILAFWELRKFVKK